MELSNNLTEIEPKLRNKFKLVKKFHIHKSNLPFLWYHSTIEACKFDFPQPPPPSQTFNRKKLFFFATHFFSCLSLYSWNSRALLIFIISSISIRGKNLCCFISFFLLLIRWRWMWKKSPFPCLTLLPLT